MMAAMTAAARVRAFIALGVIGIIMPVALAAPVGAGAVSVTDAEAAIAELTAVPAGNQVADVPECDVVRESDALAASDGQSVSQSYALQSGGVSARIIVFDSKRDAKRFQRLATSARARTCIDATIATFNRAAVTDVTSDLERARLPGIKASVVYEGPVTIGPSMVLAEYEAYARVGPVVVQVNLGEITETGARDAVEQWIIDTAKAL
jgi:hypothetical protein